MSEKGRGCLPRISKVGDGTFRVFKSEWLIPPKDWSKYDDVTLVPFVWHIINQSSQGSCNPSMCGGVTALKREEMGLNQIIFAQAGLYAFEGITSSGELIPRRRDDGMSLDTSLQLLQEVGCSPTEWEGKPWIDQYDWQGYRHGNWPDNWRDVANRFRVSKGEWWDLPDWEHFQSARSAGFPIGYGSKGHAVARIAKGLDLNSWGDDWGNNGVGQWASDAELKRDIGRYGAWAYRAATDPTDDGDV